MTKASPARRARRAHAAEVLAIRRCSSCDRYIILRGVMNQIGAHTTRDQAAAYARGVAETREALDGSCPVMILEIGATGEFGPLPCPYDALPS